MFRSPFNEPVRPYSPGSPERAAVEAKIKELAASPAELTMTVAGQQRMGGGERIAVVQPHNHAHVLGHLANADDVDVAAAIKAAAAAAPAWRAMSFDDRAAIFLKAADLLAGRGGPPSTRPPSWVSPSRCTRPRSTRPAS